MRCRLAIALVILAALSGCYPANVKPSATDLKGLIVQRNALPQAAVMLYLATVDAGGNLQKLEALTLGNRTMTTLVELNTEGLKPGEIAPLGVDGDFLITTGIQGEPRGTIQALNLKDGKTRKAIGQSITEEPWRIVAFKAPHTFVGELRVDETHVRVAERFGVASEGVTIALPADGSPVRYFGLDKRGGMFCGVGRDLVRIDFGKGTATTWATLPLRPVGIAVESEGSSDVYISSDVYMVLGAEPVNEGFGVVVYHIAADQKNPLQALNFTASTPPAWLPDGWPVSTDAGALVYSLEATPGGEWEATPTVHSLFGSRLTRLGPGAREAVWIVGNQHCFLIDEGKLLYRDLGGPEVPEVLATRAAGTVWKVFPGPAAE